MSGDSRGSPPAPRRAATSGTLCAEVVSAVLVHGRAETWWTDLAWAQVLGDAMSVETERHMVEMLKVRVNGPMSNLPGFAQRSRARPMRDGATAALHRVATRPHVPFAASAVVPRSAIAVARYRYVHSSANLRESAKTIGISR